MLHNPQPVRILRTDKIVIYCGVNIDKENTTVIFTKEEGLTEIHSFDSNGDWTYTHLEDLRGDPFFKVTNINVGFFGCLTSIDSVAEKELLDLIKETEELYLKGEIE